MATLLGPVPCRACRAPIVWSARAWRTVVRINEWDGEPIVSLEAHACDPASRQLGRRLATYVGPRRPFVDQARPVTAFGRSLGAS